MPPYLYCLLNLTGFSAFVIFSKKNFISSFSSFLPSFPRLPSQLLPSVVWSNNLLIIGCKKYLLRDYGRYKKRTGDESQNLSASIMRPGDCRACSAETEHPPADLHRGLTQLSRRKLSPTRPSSARLTTALLGLGLCN